MSSIIVGLFCVAIGMIDISLGIVHGFYLALAIFDIVVGISVFEHGLRNV